MGRCQVWKAPDEQDLHPQRLHAASVQAECRWLSRQPALAQGWFVQHQQLPDWQCRHPPENAAPSACSGAACVQLGSMSGIGPDCGFCKHTRATSRQKPGQPRLHLAGFGHRQRAASCHFVQHVGGALVPDRGQRKEACIAQALILVANRYLQLAPSQTALHHTSRITPA